MKNKEINLIGISGKIGSGKDEIAGMIQYITSPFHQRMRYWKYVAMMEWNRYPLEWKNKKFSGKLKEVASVILGVSAEKFEDREFKNSRLPHIWSKYIEDNFEKNTPSVEEWITVREFLQKLGEGVRKTVHEDFWINALFKDYQKEGAYEGGEKVASDGGYYSALSYKGEYPKWIISDVRYPNEIETIKSRGGIVIRVIRKYGNPLIMNDLYAATNWQHISETALDDYDGWDYQIDNNSDLTELIDKVKDFITKFNIV